MISILPIQNINEIGAGTDLGALLAAALAEQHPDATEADVLVVTQKIVSKAEDRLVDLASVEPSMEARTLAAATRKDARLVQLILDESSEVVRATPHVLITRHRLGLVMANAGIDRSNLGMRRRDHVLLLPRDPDGSAAAIRAALRERFGHAPAVVISDSFGRPWRRGVINVAIGVAGLPALIDRRGERDRDDRPLESTEVALADLIASAAGLAMGEAAEGVPAALVRGGVWDGPPVPATSLVRPIGQDLFR